MVDEVEVVPGGDGDGAPPSLGHPHVGLVQGLVYVDHGVEHGVPMPRGLGQALVGNGQVLGSTVLSQTHTQHVICLTLIKLFFITSS